MGKIENNLQNVGIKTNYIDNDIKCKWPNIPSKKLKL